MDRDEMQRRAQRILLREDIERFGGPEEGYRNRLDLSFFPGGLGFREPGRFDAFIDVPSSELATPRVNELLAAVRSAFLDVDPFDQKTKRGTLRGCVIRALDTASISFVVNPRSPGLAQVRERIASFAEHVDCEHVLISFIGPESDGSVSDDYEMVKGDGILTATIAGVTLSVHAQGFFQNNTPVAELMHGFARDCLADAAGTLVDLYGGVGAFACSLGSRFERAVVIEEHEGSAQLAQRNLERNGVDGEAIAGDASALAQLEARQGAIITDPPRAGMSEETALAVARYAPERIVYVSCNPLVLPRDLAYLRGYAIDRAAVFDLFPRTDHFEMVVSLKRS